MKLLYYSTAYFASHGGSLQSVNFVEAARKHKKVHDVRVYPKKPSTLNHAVSSGLRAFLRRIPLLQILFFFRRSKLNYNGLLEEIEDFGPNAVLIQTDSTFLQVKWLKSNFPELIVATIVNASPFDEPFKNIACISWFRRLERKSLLKADMNFFISESLRAHILKSEADEKKSLVVFNGVDIEKFYPIEDKSSLRNELGYDSGYFYLGYVGTVDIHKRLDILVRAMVNFKDFVPQARLVIVGDGPGMPPFIEQIRKLELEAWVQVKGWVNHSTINKHINCFDIAIHHFAQGYMNPLKLFEYHAVGVPVIAPKIPAVQEFITDEEHALLTDGTPEDIADKVKRLYEDPVMRSKIAKSGRDHIRKQFTWERHTDIIINKIQNRLGDAVK